MCPREDWTEVFSQLLKLFRFTLGQRVSLLICSISGFKSRLFIYFLDPYFFKYTAVCIFVSKLMFPCLLFLSLVCKCQKFHLPQYHEQCCKNGFVPAMDSPRRQIYHPTVFFFAHFFYVNLSLFLNFFNGCPQ